MKVYTNFGVSSLCLLLLLHLTNGQTRGPTTRGPRPTTIGPTQATVINGHTLIFIPGYSQQSGAAWGGGAIQSGITTVSACSTRCNSLADCRSFDFNTQYSQCFTHNFDTCPENNKLLCGECFHYKKNSNSNCAFMEGISGVSIYNGMRAPNTIQTLVSCLRYCDSQISCIAVDYNSAEKSCWWHTSTTGCNNGHTGCRDCTHYRHKRSPCAVSTPAIPTTPGTTLGTGTLGTPGTQGTGTPGTPGTPDSNQGKVYDFGQPGRSITGGEKFDGTFSGYIACFNKCTATPTCQGVDYDSVKMECWRHTASTICKETNTYCRDCTHYKNTRASCYMVLSTLPPTEAPTTPIPIGDRYVLSYDNTRIAGGTFREVVTDLDDCLRLCDSVVSCQAVVYEVSSTGPICLLHYANTACSTRTAATGFKTLQHLRITCGDDVFDVFGTQIPNRRIQIATTHTASSLIECLEGCRADVNCRGINYRLSDSRCERISFENQCSLQETASGYVHYLLRTVICSDDPVFQAFTQVQINRRHILATNPYTRSLINCLKDCNTLAGCQGINYRTSNQECQRVLTGNGCFNINAATGYNYYRRITVTCASTSTTSTSTSTTSTTPSPAPRSEIENCWNKMTTNSNNCNKPEKSIFASNYGKMEEYCRGYNQYFGCILKRRSTDCPSLTWYEIGEYVGSLSDTMFQNVQFCDIFSEALYTCLENQVIRNEVARCGVQLNLIGNEITATTEVATREQRCPFLREYTTCVQSVLNYRCKDHAEEFNMKSIRNILGPGVTNCESLSPPTIREKKYFGPRSGQPKLIINGPNLLRIHSTPTILLDDVNPCSSMTTRNMTHMQCTMWTLNLLKARNLGKVIEVNQAMTVRLVYSHKSGIYFTAGNFTYKPDPTVTKLEPSTTVIGGGTRVTVKGSNLRYVVTPELQVTSKYERTTTQIHKSICEHGPDGDSIDTSPLICKVPSIFIPSGVNPGEMVPNLDVYTGLILDGILTYENLTAAGVTEGGHLQAYGPPDIDSNPERVYEFKLFWPVLQTTLEIPGRALPAAATADDYTVLIGPEMCMKVQITEDTISCEPPQQNPITNGTDPPIIVRAPGPQQNQNGIAVGKLNYQNSIFDNTAGKFGLIGGAIGVVVLFIILIVLCVCFCPCCSCRRDREKFEDDESE